MRSSRKRPGVLPGKLGEELMVLPFPGAEKHVLDVEGEESLEPFGDEIEALLIGQTRDARYYGDRVIDGQPEGPLQLGFARPLLVQMVGVEGSPVCKGPFGDSSRRSLCR